MTASVQTSNGAAPPTSTPSIDITQAVPAAPPPVAAAGPERAQPPRAVRRVRTLEVPDSEAYPGFTFDVWLNVPWPVVEELQSGDYFKALRQMVLRTNGWVDFDGVPYPPPSEEAFWKGDRAVPPDLQSMVLAELTKALRANPLAPPPPAPSDAG